jgi:GTPase Era involved in 16S rRNA processing
MINDISKVIKVVSIVGRQSSGKSYVMNRLFGTRFNVASTRCTDGIWMSVVEMYDQEDKANIFIVLDCEGLFSARRNEVMLGLISYLRYN